MDALDDVDPGRAGILAFGAFLTLVLAFVVVSFLGVFVLGVFLYYATRPFYRRFDARIPSPSLAALLALLTLALPVLLLTAYTVGIAITELGEFLEATDAESVRGVVEPYVNVTSAIQDPQGLIERAGTGRITDVAASALTYLGFVLASVLELFVAFTLAYYLLKDGPRLRHLLENYLADRSAVLDEGGHLEEYFDTVDADLETVFFGNILNAMLIAAIGAVSFNTLNLFAPPGVAIPYPALLGILAGVASLIPVVGMKIVYVPMIGYVGFLAFDQGGGWGFLAAFVFVAVVIVDTIPDLALRPYVSGGDLHLGTVLFAYIFGPLLFGWYGLFLGPLLLVLAVHFYRVLLDIDGSDSPIVTDDGGGADTPTGDDDPGRESDPESPGGDSPDPGTD